MLTVRAQDSSGLNKALSFPNKIFTCLERRASILKQNISKKTSQYLLKLQRQEHLLKRKLTRKDPELPIELFGNIDNQYKAIKGAAGQLIDMPGGYASQPDSFSTALNFIIARTLQLLARTQPVRHSLNLSWCNPNSMHQNTYENN